MDCARHLVEAFANYNAEFRAITRRAPQRFDGRDWKASQRDAVERIELYDRFVNQTVAELREALGSQALDRELWRQVRREFAELITDLPDPEFTKTFFSSVTRRLFGTVGVAPDIEFVATDLDPLAAVHSSVGTNTYVNHGSLPLLFEDLLGDVRFRSPWRDLDKSIAHVAAEVRAYLDSKEERRAVEKVINDCARLRHFLEAQRAVASADAGLTEPSPGGFRHSVAHQVIVQGHRTHAELVGDASRVLAAVAPH